MIPQSALEVVARFRSADPALRRVLWRRAQRTRAIRLVRARQAAARIAARLR